MRLELTRSCDHYPLKVACIPISPPAPAFSYRTLAVPRTGLEPARLATYAPETYASTNSATWASRSFRKSKQNIRSAHFFRRAANETRTRDPDLGKVVLYQLSYCRSAFSKSCYRMLLCNIKRAIASAFPTTTLRLRRGPHYRSFSKITIPFRKSGCKSTTNF